MVVPGARMDDLDPQAIAVYRRSRAAVNPSAEELSYPDIEMLEALGMVSRVSLMTYPTLAGLVLFGKALSLRRLLPAIRVDYIRVAWNEWVEDPEDRYATSIEFLKPLLIALPQIEASIIDDLPKGFQLPEGALQSKQEPVVSRKVVREALANAVMHRDYLQHHPTQVIRYGNRIELNNAGRSLKDPGQLGFSGSFLRNPVIAAVMHDLNMAEAKGTGIRAIKGFAQKAGLAPPEFNSDRQTNQFTLKIFLHTLMTEAEHRWLQTLKVEANSDEAKVLLYARSTGSVDNSTCRNLCGLDTLSSSMLLRKLRVDILPDLKDGDS